MTANPFQIGSRVRLRSKRTWPRVDSNSEPAGEVTLEPGIPWSVVSIDGLRVNIEEVPQRKACGVAHRLRGVLGVNWQALEAV